MTAPTLADFLLARIAEDETVAQSAMGRMILGLDGTPMARHVARYSPARVLADCEAKKALIDGHRGEHECPRDGDNCGYWVNGEGCDVLRWIALPYAPRPDYDAAWRP